MVQFILWTIIAEQFTWLRMSNDCALECFVTNPTVQLNLWPKWDLKVWRVLVHLVARCIKHSRQELEYLTPHPQRCHHLRNQVCGWALSFVSYDLCNCSRMELFLPGLVHPLFHTCRLWGRPSVPGVLDAPPAFSQVAVRRSGREACFLHLGEHRPKAKWRVQGVSKRLSEICTVQTRAH